MAILKIARLGHPVLRQRAREVTRDELAGSEVRGLIDSMIETMRDAQGAGLAAPQVHRSLRLCVVELSANSRYPGLDPIALSVFVNPIITPIVQQLDPLELSESISVYEGCLSIPGLRGLVRRPRRVRVDALDPSGQPKSLELEGFPAAVIQHETDHLDGTLFVDRAEPGTLTFLEEYLRYVPVEDRMVDHGRARAPEADGESNR